QARVVQEQPEGPGNVTRAWLGLFGGGFGVNADAVVGEGHVRDVGRPTGHVTLHTVVVGALAQPAFLLHRTPLPLVTAHTDGPVVLDALVRPREGVRVVTGRAGEGPGFLVAAAQVHLLHVTDHRHRLVIHFQPVVLPEVLQR